MIYNKRHEVENFDKLDFSVSRESENNKQNFLNFLKRCFLLLIIKEYL